MARPWNSRRVLLWGLGLAFALGLTFAALAVLGVRAANARLEPDAAGWTAAAESFHARAAREKELDASRTSPVFGGTPLPGNAAAGYVRALQLVPARPNAPGFWRNLSALARIHPGPGGEDREAAGERSFLDANRAAIAALVSATRCESVSWGVDFESEPDHQALPGPRARLFSGALTPLGLGCLAVAREKALAGDADGALEHVLAAARWAIDELPTVSSHRALLSRLSAEHLAWLATKLPPGWLGEHAAAIRHALDTLEARVPTTTQRIAQERFEHERNMVAISDEMEHECDRVPLLGPLFKQYSAPLARALASRDAGLNEERELLLEGERAAAIPDPQEQRRALEALDARWPGARPGEVPTAHLAFLATVSDNECARLALARAVLEIEERFERDGRAPREWTLPRAASVEPWVYQPRDDGLGWRVVFCGSSPRDPRPRLVVIFER